MTEASPDLIRRMSLLVYAFNPAPVVIPGMPTEVDIERDVYPTLVEALDALKRMGAPQDVVVDIDNLVYVFNPSPLHVAGRPEGYTREEMYDMLNRATAFLNGVKAESMSGQPLEQDIDEAKDRLGFK